VASRTFSSLVADEIFNRLFTIVRNRAAKQQLFSGIAVALNDPIGLRLMATGMFEATQFDGIAALLETPQVFGLQEKPTGMFIDVGANIGLFTIAFSKFFDRTLSIEANAQTYAILQVNILLQELSAATPLCFAASNSIGASSIFVPADGSLGGATMNPLQHSSPKRIDVECRPLDVIVEQYGDHLPVGLIKIDVEGHEYNVLDGARKTLSGHKPIVMFEALDPSEATRCANILVDCGYRRFFSFKRGHTGSRLKAILAGFRQGLPVYPEYMTINTIRRSPLICAVK
jgi:FkbM family methyltransferase